MATIAFLGLGHMGGPMAANLIAAGHTVHGFDPVPAAAQAARGTRRDDLRQRPRRQWPVPTSSSPCCPTAIW